MTAIVTPGITNPLLISGDNLSERYPIKAKIELEYDIMSKYKEKFITSLDLNEITEQGHKNNFVGNLGFKPSYQDANYKVGFYGPSDHQSIIFIETHPNNKKLCLCIYNNEKYILRDYNEIKEKLKNSFWLCKWTYFLHRWYPAKIKYYFYINRVELDERGVLSWIKGNFIRYVILFATPVITIYWNDVLNTPLKEINFSTAKILFWLYVIIFFVEYLIMNQREEFCLELKEPD